MLNSKIVVRTGLVLLGITASLSAQTFPEALPDPIRARLEVRDRFLRSLPPTLSGRTAMSFDSWRAGCPARS